MSDVAIKIRQIPGGTFGASILVDGELVEGCRLEGVGRTVEEAEFALLCVLLVVKDMRKRRDAA